MPLGGARLARRIALGHAPLADHPVDDHVLEAVQRLLEPVAEAPAGEGGSREALLDALDDLDVLAVDLVPEARAARRRPPRRSRAGVDSGWREQVRRLERRPGPRAGASMMKMWFGRMLTATLGNSQTNRALTASSVVEARASAGSPSQPPSSVSCAIGVVQKPVYMPVPCQRWCALIGETLTSPGCTQGRW